MKKRFMAVTLALVMLLSLTVMSFAATTSGFDDVPDDAWFAPGVIFCKEKGLMSGVSDKEFNPNGTMTRGMMAAVMWRAVGEPKIAEKDYGEKFTDVKPGAYYEKAIYWYRNNGVMSGYSNTEFGPDDNITREQIVTVLWRYIGSPEAKAEAFVDRDQIAAYAVKAVDWARNTKVVSGFSDGSFGPQALATRAQVATIFRNYIGD